MLIIICHNPSGSYHKILSCYFALMGTFLSTEHSTDSKAEDGTIDGLENDRLSLLLFYLVRSGEIHTQESLAAGCTAGVNECTAIRYHASN